MKVAQNTDHPERRRSQRSGHIIEGWLSSHGSPDRTEVTTFDISRHGMSFEATFSIPAGQEFIYEIGIGNQSLICDIRIVTCKALPNRIWHIGAEFI
jgi:hypothetical protein